MDIKAHFGNFLYLMNVFEGENHVLLKCPIYADLRNGVFNDSFMNMSDNYFFSVFQNKDIILPKSVTKFYHEIILYVRYFHNNTYGL